MKHLVFLLEEPSAMDLLMSLVPKLVPAETKAHYLVFDGKQDLEKNVTRKLRGWMLQDSAFLILRDQDAGDCKVVKQRLQRLVAGTGQRHVLVRIACKELESWILGDFAAVGKAFEKPQLEAQGNKATYRNPDCLANPVEELRKFLPYYQKRDGARRVGPHMDLEQNRSRSFHHFCKGVRRLVSSSSSCPS